MLKKNKKKLFKKNLGNEQDFSKVFSLDIEKSDDENNFYKISGIASSYENIDSDGDLFKTGSLDEEIGKTVQLRVDHNRDINSIVGKVTIEKKGKLIKFTGELLKGDPLAEKIALMKAQGIPLKTSIGGRILKSKWEIRDSKDVRVFEKATIEELSIVTSGANPLATVEKNKNEGLDMEKLDIILKSLGVLTEKLEAFEKIKGNEDIGTEIKKQISDLKENIEKGENSVEIEELKKQLKAMDEIMKSREINTGNKAEEKIDLNLDIRKSIFSKYSETFEKSSIEEFTKANQITDFADVKTIIPVKLQDDLIKDIGEFSPLFGDSKKIQFKGTTTSIPMRVKQPNGIKDALLGEGVDGIKVVYTSKSLTKGVLQSEAALYDEVVADVQYNLMSDIREITAEDFGMTLADRILKGIVDTSNVNANKFEGIQKHTSFMANRTKEQLIADTLDWKELQSMIRKIPTGKRSNMCFYVAPEAADLMETMVDKNNRPLWRDSISGGTPSTFLGFPVKEVFNMGKEVGDLIVLFANMSQLYVIGSDYEMKMEPERKARERKTNIITNSRMGGIVRDEECGYAIKKK